MEGEFDLQRTIEALQDGSASEESFRRLFVRFRPALERFFARCGIPQEERGDLTQETFLGIYSGIGGFRRESRFERWIFTIAANVYRKYLRRRSTGKRSGEEVSLEEAAPGTGTLLERMADESSGPPDPEQSLIESERTRQLLREIDDLPDKMRKCLILRSFQDLTYEEIAVAMRLSPETVRSHLFHARRRLRERLAGSGDPGDDRG